MAIEPLGSMTAVQVQSTTKIQAPEASAKAAGENKNVISQEAAVPKMADATVTVAKGTESGAYSGDSASEKQADSEAIRKAVSNINKNINANTEAVFGFHEATNRITIKIIDKQSKEVIKELPPEKTLDMIAKIWEMAGILVDEKR
ncbi:MAG: flagellar protein FlaG [Lachnospiraceae bacterium]|nr:flagellar protein FlaG [Lachnospiraceae bacterium]